MSFGASSSQDPVPPEAIAAGQGPNEQDERELLERLSGISPPTSSGPVIAVDLDDVLSQTNFTVSQWHNNKYGTDMDVTKFYYYYYWKNPYWGTPSETFAKVTEFYATGSINNAPPVPGAREGIQALRDMGYRLIIVTARSKDVSDESWEWVSKHFPGLFESIICTGHFDAQIAGTKSTHEIVTKMSKAEVCADLSAKLLIDDSVENAVDCATFPHPNRPHVLLFGAYEWNKRVSSPSDRTDEMSFARRLEAAGGREFWVEEAERGVQGLDQGSGVERVRDWGEVVRWVQRAKAEGRM
ncbi:hypothetical protein PLICRDRAFT_35907 [Plicaturopsis crispa FD-325 SS-3]|nr:hypothetical protein PLICRDRAFT_35907 [Plicaturopsis crispa FD-325 SS-3]